MDKSVNRTTVNPSVNECVYRHGRLHQYRCKSYQPDYLEEHRITCRDLRYANLAPCVLCETVVWSVVLHPSKYGMSVVFTASVYTNKYMRICQDTDVVADPITSAC
jgi:hypothetical protein